MTQGIEQEAPADVTGPSTARRTERSRAPANHLGRLRWQLRAGGVIFAIIAAAILSLAHAAGVGWQFHALNGLVFVAVTVIACTLAAVSRTTHVQKHYQAQLLTEGVESQDKAMRDYLTQLFNRRYFFERLAREVDRARNLQSLLSILVLDIDQLDAINEAYGHKAGDIALAKLAKVIVRCTRTSDIPARLGADEFGVIMPDTDRRGAFVVATRIRRTLEATPVYEKDGHSVTLTVSLGVSGFPWDGEDVDELVQKADTSMYVVKATRQGDSDSSGYTPSAPTLTG